MPTDGTTTTTIVDDSRNTERARDAALVAAIRDGDEAAFGDLYNSWFDRVYGVARRILRDDAAAADVAQDAFLAAWRNIDTLDDTAAFGGWLLRIARNRALDRRAKDMRSSPVDGEGFAVIEDTAASAAGAPAGFAIEDRLRTADDPAHAAEQADLAALVWDAADALGERDATVLDLTLRYDLDAGEVATVLDVNRNNAHQLIHRCRNRLGDAVRARVLWRGGSPDCDTLATALSLAGISAFDADAVKAINKHATACDECTDVAETRLAPSALFAAIPIAVAPFALKARVAHALAAEGVPVDVSTIPGSADAGEQATEPGSQLANDTAPNTAEVQGPQIRVPAHDTTPGVAAARRASHNRLLVAAAAVIAVVVFGVIGLVLARPTGQDASIPVVESEAEVTTTAPDEAAATNPATTVAPTTSGPAPTTTTAPPVPPGPPAVETFGISTLRIPAEYPMAGAPILSWAVTEGANVEVAGPGGLGTGATSGSEALCPGVEQLGVCVADTGNYIYTLILYDAEGNVIDSRIASFSIF